MSLLEFGQRRISVLFAACFFSVLALSVAFSSVIIYRLAHLQARASVLYDRSLLISQAGQTMLADVSRMNNVILEAILAPEAGTPEEVPATLQALDTGLRRELSVVVADVDDFRAAEKDITRQLDVWHATHARIIDHILHNRHDQALALGMGANIQLYHQLDMSMAALEHNARARTTALANDAVSGANQGIREAWWTLGVLALFNVLCGVTVFRRISRIMTDDSRLVTRLQDNEQRLKMALSAGNQGTWDLDIATGKLTFDSEWARLLDYQDEHDRPATMDQWADKIHSEDRDRVVREMHEHIVGHTPEYRAEYRIHNKGGKLRWVAGFGKAMDRNDNGIATRVVGITQDITQRKYAEKEIWNLAHSDLLTGLPNRVLLYDRLNQMIAYARRHGQMFALFFLDLDGFKQVNDEWGHDIGDKLLQEVAGRLGGAVRREDTVARVGGDEFIFLLSGIHAPEDAATIADNVLTVLRKEFMIDDHPCHIGGSIGIALFPHDSDDMDTLVSHADDAMYQAKAKGKNSYQFYQPSADPSPAA